MEGLGRTGAVGDEGKVEVNGADVGEQGHCKITTTRTVLMARKSLFCQLLAGLVGRMTSLALPISLLEDCASFWHWLLPLYILSSQGKYFKSFIALWFRP